MHGTFRENTLGRTCSAPRSWHTRAPRVANDVHVGKQLSDSVRINESTKEAGPPPRSTRRFPVRSPGELASGRGARPTALAGPSHTAMGRSPSQNITMCSREPCRFPVYRGRPPQSPAAPSVGPAPKAGPPVRGGGKGFPHSYLRRPHRDSLWACAGPAPGVCSQSHARTPPRYCSVNHGELKPDSAHAVELRAIMRQPSACPPTLKSGPLCATCERPMA